MSNCGAGAAPAFGRGNGFAHSGSRLRHRPYRHGVQGHGARRPARRHRFVAADDRGRAGRVVSTLTILSSAISRRFWLEDGPLYRSRACRRHYGIFRRSAPEPRSGRKAPARARRVLSFSWSRPKRARVGRNNHRIASATARPMSAISRAGNGFCAARARALCHAHRERGAGGNLRGGLAGLRGPHFRWF